MSLYLDGFDHYTSTSILSQMWDTVNSSNRMTLVSGGRAGVGNYLKMDAISGNTPSLIKNFPSGTSSFTVGFAIYFEGFSTSANHLICRSRNGTTVQVDLRVDTSGGVFVTRNGTTLGSVVSGVFVASRWYYLEFQATLNDTTGTVIVRVNNNEIINLTGQDTNNAASNIATNIQIGYPSDTGFGGPVGRFDDVYIRDDTTFLGDVKVATSLVSGSGSNTDFTPSTGSNYQNVDDTNPNDDTDYNSSSTVNHKDTFAIGGLSLVSGASIKAIQVVNYARKDDAGARVLRNYIKSGSSTAEGSDYTLSTGYTYSMSVHTTDPATGSAWTPAAIDALEVGYKIQS